MGNMGNSKTSQVHLLSDYHPNKPVRRIYCPTIPRTIDELNKNDLGNPSHIIIHTGTNDIENSTLDSCVGDFQLMVDIALQKYPNAKILVSTLLVRADNFNSTRKSLNTKISQLLLLQTFTSLIMRT